MAVEFSEPAARRAKAKMILTRIDERTDHRSIVIRRKIGQDIHPVDVTIEFSVAAEESEIHHPDERRVEFSGLEAR